MVEERCETDPSIEKEASLPSGKELSSDRAFAVYSRMLLLYTYAEVVSFYLSRGEIGDAKEYIQKLKALFEQTFGDVLSRHCFPLGLVRMNTALADADMLLMLLESEIMVILTSLELEDPEAAKEHAPELQEHLRRLYKKSKEDYIESGAYETLNLSAHANVMSHLTALYRNVNLRFLALDKTSDVDLCFTQVRSASPVLDISHGTQSLSVDILSRERTPHESDSFVRIEATLKTPKAPVPFWQQVSGKHTRARANKKANQRFGNARHGGGKKGNRR